MFSKMVYIFGKEHFLPNAKNKYTREKTYELIGRDNIRR